MDFARLQSAINAGFSEKTFTFNQGSLSSQNIQTLFQDLLKTDSIVLQTESPGIEDLSKQHITINGIANSPFWGASGLSVELDFFITQSQAQLKIVFSGFPDNWTLADPGAFPSLENTLPATLPFTAVQLILDSLPPDKLPPNFQTAFGLPPDATRMSETAVNGLSFQARLAKNSVPESLQWILFDDEVNEIEFSGPLRLIGKMPELWLKTKETAQLTLLGMHFSKTGEIVSLLSEDSSGNGETEPWVFGRVVSKFSFDLKGRPFIVPFSLYFNRNDPFLVSLRSEPGLSGAALAASDIPSLFSFVTNIDDFVPDGFPELEGLELQALGFDLDAEKNEVQEAFISLRFKQVWEVFAGLIKFSDLQLLFIANNFEDSEGTNVQLVATGHAEVAQQKIDARIELPSLTFFVYLPDGEILDIKAFAESLTNTTIGIPDLIATSFSINGNITENIYFIRARIESNWEIDLSITILELQAIQLDIQSLPEFGTRGHIFSQFAIGGVPLFISAQSNPNEIGWTFQGGTLGNVSISIGTLKDDLANMFGPIELPDVLQGLEITNLQVSFNTATKDFHFIAETAFPIDGKSAALSLNIDIVNATSGFQKSFSGILTLGSRQFSVLFDFTPPSTSFFNAFFSNPEGEKIDLITDIVDLVSENSPLTFPNTASNLELTELILYELQLVYTRTNDVSTYGIVGDFTWEPQINLTGDSASSFNVRALVDLTKNKGNDQKVLGEVRGDIQNTIAGLEFLSMGVCYVLKEEELKLQLTIGQVMFSTAYNNTEGNVSLAFKAEVEEAGSLTLGEVITFMVSLVDPSIDDFEFDPPWNFITDYDLAPFLDSIQLNLEIIKTTKKKKFSIVFEELDNLVPGDLSTFLTITSLELEYSSLNKKTDIILDADFLGESQELKWDPINDAPPEIPGQGASVFELRYLGMGQHIALKGADQVTAIKEVMGLLQGAIIGQEENLQKDRSLALRNPLETFGDDGVIAFSPESEWLIGLDVSLLKTLNLTIIFNDPVIYGLRIELYGKQAKNFAGLEFEILYQRISDTTGKYHVDLTLPDKFRHFQIGAVSVTLPLIVVDIFTNGDFKVDLGFPWDFNFSRSFALELFPFTGAGGFYFNKLSAATTTLTPTLLPGQELKPAEQGVFTPVYEFGLGLRVGYGKSFKSGPLNAEIQITVQGLVTGVISWYNPIVPAGERALYYKIGGGVAVVGRLYGEVDFDIISVSVEVIARTTIIFLVEVYQPIQILLAAEVSVKASVKVSLVKVKFSFSLTVEQSFTIASPQGDALPPWVK